MEKPVSRLPEYESIKDENFRGYIATFHEYLDHRVGDGPVLRSDFVKHPFPARLGLSAKDLDRIVDYCTKSGSVECQILPGKRTSVLDIQGCLAIACISRSMVLRYTEDINFKANIRGPWGAIPWKEIIEETKTALGDHLLAQRMHYIRPTPKHIRESIFGANTVISKKKDEDNFIELPNHFPVINEDGRTLLSTIDMQALQPHIDKAQGDVEDVDPLRHNAPSHVLQATMFIYFANRKELHRFDANKEDYPVLLYRKGLLLVWKCLRDFKNTKNLGDLLGLVEETVRKNPNAFSDPDKPIK